MRALTSDRVSLGTVPRQSIRQHPNLHRIWATLRDADALWVSLDSCRSARPWRAGCAETLLADGSIMPRVTTGNTMVPCVVTGEKAAEFLNEKHACEKRIDSYGYSSPGRAVAHSQSCAPPGAPQRSRDRGGASTHSAART